MPFERSTKNPPLVRSRDDDHNGSPVSAIPNSPRSPSSTPNLLFLSPPPTSPTTFEFHPLPPQLFHFPPSTDSHFLTPSSLKRRRPLTDIDGSSREYTKKRRCRLQLNTSRLSAPFAIPPTNIPERPPNNPRTTLFLRGRPRSAVVQSAFLLRKAAILNKIKKEREEMVRRKEEERRVFRERLAAAARAPERRENIMRFCNGRVGRQRIPSLGLSTPSPIVSAMPCLPTTPPLGLGILTTEATPPPSYLDLTQFLPPTPPLELGYITPSTIPSPLEKFNVHSILPHLHRPPTPPSEGELEQRMKEGCMGLNIGDVF
ncbi:hypothetical protein EX30DRAFT_344270 [Ascodesmis nigricans]|uniref:Uncharacterized protein n=1 Tax=Ascodesmis nigricans TaxID=341454 RepID=A0A4S2MKB2_9PEZI|nr:hypothetical protein EX30DRAFT_344270 [Ascodesmis nigricans]